MTSWFLNTYFKGKWFLYGHFTVTSLGIILLFPYIQLWSNIVYLLMTVKELYEWKTRGYFDWRDQKYNTYGLIFANIYCWITFYWLSKFLLVY